MREVEGENLVRPQRVEAEEVEEEDKILAQTLCIPWEVEVVEVGGHCPASR